MAFVTRAHRHLWGKNNEDPMVFLYLQGLTHDFIRQMHLGWNKHSQHRDLSKWGIAGTAGQLDLSRCLLPAGIVFPHIVEKNLLAVIILPIKDGGLPWLMPGSRRDIVLGPPDPSPPAVYEDLFAGLRHFQASGSPVRLKPAQWDPVTSDLTGGR
jgi:hypothetical protein